MSLALDIPVLDLIYPAKSPPNPEAILAALGAAETCMVLDVDLDVPQYETEIAPTVGLRRRDERRVLVVDEAQKPMRRSPRSEPIVPRDLRPDKKRLAQVVTQTGARMGRLGAFGSWGDAALVCSSPRDLRAVMLLGWLLDPTTGADGIRRATPLSQREFEEKLVTYGRRLDELDDATILSRVPPAHLERRNDCIIVDVLSDRDGSWDVRSSYELEKRIAALDLFARIPGARITPPAQTPEPPSPAAPLPQAPQQPTGPPIHAEDLAGRIILRIPSERFDLDAVTALGRRHLDLLRPHDGVSSRDRDRIHHEGCGFIAPLAFLSEVFIDGRPLDRRRFETEGRVSDHTRVLEAHLPRFGRVLVLEVSGRRFVTSEVSADLGRLLALAAKL